MAPANSPIAPTLQELAHGNRSERDKFIAKQEFPMFDGSQEYCLWLGCMGAYDPHGREIVIAFSRLHETRHVGQG